MSSNRVPVENFIGTPFKGCGAGGRDCWELVKAIYLECYEVDIPMTYDIAHDATIRVSRAFIAAKMNPANWKPLDAPQDPCVVAIANHPDHPELVNHCGIYIGNGFFIHARQATGAVMERIASPLWERKIRGYYKWIGAPAK
jgi:cell wall-associated NlpC family hydrolase